MIDGAHVKSRLRRKYVEGYRRKPESPLVGRLGEKMAREVWPKETWDEVLREIVGLTRQSRRTRAPANITERPGAPKRHTRNRKLFPALS
jgi:hypothetical protein